MPMFVKNFSNLSNGRARYHVRILMLLRQDHVFPKERYCFPYCLVKQRTEWIINVLDYTEIVLRISTAVSLNRASMRVNITPISLDITQVCLKMLHLRTFQLSRFARGTHDFSTQLAVPRVNLEISRLLTRNQPQSEHRPQINSI